MEVEFWQDRNVFVTGGTGLLGAWLVEELLDKGAKVTCLVRDWVPGRRLIDEGLVKRINIVRGALEDYPLLLRVLNEYEIDTVFHLGAQTIVTTASRSPISTFDSNIRGTWNLLEACKDCSKLIERVVIASSDKAYGSQKVLPYTEDAPLDGRYPYDASKACTEIISFSYHKTYGVPLAITRCGNLFGGGDLYFNRIIPGTIQSALKNEAPIIRSDGLFIRDYFYVKDAVKAYLTLAEHLPHEKTLGEAFNFGPEIPVSVLDLVEVILDLMDAKHLKPKVLNQASHEIREQYLDCRKARQVLNWKSAYTLEQGLKETINWYKEYLAYPIS